MASAYSPAQIQQYESHVALPTRFRQSSNPLLDPAYLTALHVHQLAAIPYENLILHYSATHAVSLEPQTLFKKMVTDARGRGGYCMENSILFHHILQALGFKVYMAGVRIRPRAGGVPDGKYTGWVHIVNIVTLADKSRYMLDVGFGGDGATKPLPLVAGHVTQNLGTQEIRLMQEPLPHSSQPDQLHVSSPTTSQSFTRLEFLTFGKWIYQYRNSQTQNWNSFYAFPELEFFARDFEIMSYYTSTSLSERNFQTRTVLVIRFLKGERENEGIVGKVMMVDGKLKRNDGGKTSLVMVCENEAQRIQALKEHFGIRLTDEEVGSVRGRNVELVGR
ncbi:Arylamine N-acetyltransferase [Lachnellula suecica]|uniref:Arylamine N-acetyltransferase n=1 Tax=Lachnellula suecica TaxID=602035 RepID=A0A8T9BV19_9HELO|nr:Arylamine N-acetyltransferase [Lachnellula suecica]